MELNLTNFDDTTQTVNAIEIFFEKFAGEKTIWISPNNTHRRDDVLVVVESNGITKIFPYAANIAELQKKKLIH